LHRSESTTTADDFVKESIAAILCTRVDRVSQVIRQCRTTGRIPPRPRQSAASGRKTVANAKPERAERVPMRPSLARGRPGVRNFSSDDARGENRRNGFPRIQASNDQSALEHTHERVS
jgi:hypothetical protein